MRLHTLPLILLLVACRTKDETPVETGLTGQDSGADSGGGDSSGGDSAIDDSGGGDSSAPTDSDGDGVSAEEDCDDADPSAYPGAVETCDNVDNNCDGAIDEGVTTTFYRDGDSDGYGVDGDGLAACEAPEGYAALAGDCDDGDARFNPGAAETDCADPNDYNCDGSVGYNDADSDGFAACEDCDDSQPTVNPAGVETCDTLDNNCDGAVDEGVTTTYYRDGDGDGHGDADYPDAACALSAGYAEAATDCDDGDAAVNPDASEICDSRDNDCDSLIDDADPSLDLSTAGTYAADDDGDGYGDDDRLTSACVQPSATTTVGGDCDDSDATVSPGAAETWYDGVDGDCSGGSDYDQDGDGQDSDGFSGADCDDLEPAVYDGAIELCDSVDNDCDGEIIDVDLDLDGVRDMGVGALDLPGSDDYVYVAASSALAWGTGDWTIELWTLAEHLSGPNAPGQARLLNHSNGGYPSNPWWVIDIYESTGKVEMEVAGWNAARTSPISGSGTSTAGMAIGEWIHIAIVSDRSAGTVQFYFNGEDAGSYTTSTEFQTADVTTPAYLQLGSTWNDWQGMLDEVRLWTTARTQAEVQANMCSGLTGAETDLQGYWSFESSATDEGPNALGGTIMGDASLVSY
ncbi:MAG: hypothetical protein RIT28_2556 [Pseudomonadota bacterium]